MAEHHEGVSTEIINSQGEDFVVSWKHPSHICQRLLALFFMCLIGFGKYFLICVYSTCI